MAKKAKSKMNRRTKRIIRRSVAALLMITAIGIAAIPAKEVAADTVSETVANKRKSITNNANADTTNFNRTYNFDPTSTSYPDLEFENAIMLKPARKTNGELDLDADGKVTVNGVKKDVNRTYAISQLSNGEYELKWQFEYYDAGNPLGLILAKYNNEYQADSVTLPVTGATKFLVVTPYMLNAFYLDTSDNKGAHEYKLTYATDYAYYLSQNKLDYNTNTVMFQNFFPEKFSSFWSACDSYQNYVDQSNAHAQWETDRDNWAASTGRPASEYAEATGHDEPDVPAPTQNPNEVSVVPSEYFATDMTNGAEKRKQFYCDKTFSSFGTGFTLVEVNDRVGYYDGYTYTAASGSTPESYTKKPAEFEIVNGIENPKTGATLDSTVAHTIYAVSANGKTPNSGKVVDGFIAFEKSGNINGIADKTFQNVGNINKLILPDEVTYIGDEAFVGSFIKEIVLKNVANIGNRAFKGCTQLKTVTLEKGTMNIGKEAFSGSGITSITLPVTTQLIGPGAFANCKELNTVDLSAISGNENTDIRDYAFFDCNYLNNVIFPEHGIYHMGEGAFAVVSGVNGSWTTTVLPSSIKKQATLKKTQPSDPSVTAEGLGNFLFAGRTNLQSVTLPGDYCIEPRDDYAYELQADDNDTDFTDGDYSLKNPTSYNVMPAGMFKGCSGLKEVIFPDTAAYAKFHPYMFLDVTNQDFAVKGPMSKPIDGAAAIPRYSTWNAITKVSDFVPYIYIDNSGKEIYEVSDGTYILTVEQDGTLTGCTLVDAAGTSLIDMVIPDKVGDTKVKTIASNCFDDATKKRIKSLTFEDDSVSSISPNAFSGMKELKTLYVGDSVESIGDKAFYDCNKLEKVVIGNGTKTIGNSAFEDCDVLLTVDIGNAVTNVGEKAFYKCPTVSDISFASPKGGYNSLTVGTDAFKTTGSKLTLHGDIQGGYALFDWATDKNNTIDDLGTRVCYMSPSPSYLRVIYDNNTEEITLVDYPKFESLDRDHADHNKEMQDYYSDPVRGIYAVDNSSNNEQRTAFAKQYHEATDAERAGYKSWSTYGPWIYDNDGVDSTEKYEFTYESTPYSVDPFYNANYEYSIIRNVNTEKPRGEFESPTPYEQQWIDATKNIVVPQGVTSIDINGYINDSQKNSINVQKYLKTLPGYEMYSKSLQDKDNTEALIDGIYSVPGLFSGYYKDYELGTSDKSNYEKNLRGNDSIESITLTSVKKLPDNCFDSCEKLKTVNIGADCEDIGTAPFRGCQNLSNVGGNDNYVYDNGIIYSVNDDGSYTIEECLSSRGNVIGTALINLNNDKNLSKVSAIKDGAFEECDTISNVDLSAAESLKEIPEKAFKNCDMLSFVTLPESVNSIKNEAFAGDKPISVTIPGTEVAIATSAFEESPAVNIRTYEDSAALEYAKYHKLSYELISEKYRVLFYDYDGKQLGEAQYIESGKSATEPEVPKHEGMTFTGWSDSPNNVTKDLILIAQYSGGSVSGGDAGNGGSGSGSGGSGSGSGSGGSGSGGSGSGGSGSGDSTGSIYRVTVVNGSGTGDYLAGRTVTITANTGNGKTFSNWSSNDGVAFANSTSATTTFTMPSKNVTVTAYYTTSGTVSGNTSGANRNNNAGTTGTRVAINKPGISNTNLASAKVNGSTDDFIVKISETAEATAAVERALINEYGSLDGLKYFAMDITLWDSNGATKITDTTGLSVDITIPLPDSLKDYAGNNKTVAVVNDQLEPLPPKFTTIDGVPCVTFRATHFSPYAIYVDTGNLTEGTRPDGTPKTADGIHPKWFLSIGLAALSLILFFKRDKVRI